MTNIARRNPSALTSLTSLAAESGGSGGDSLLRLLRDGLWVMGVDNDEPDPDSLWAINPYSFHHGFIAWHDSQVEGEVMVPFDQPLPKRDELKQVTEGWDDQLAFELLCIAGPDKGVKVLYKTTSVSGKRAVGSMATDIARQASDGDEVVPVVALDIDSYQHKKYGRIYTPVFEVQEWVSMDNSIDQAVEQAEEKQEAAPPSRQTRTRTRARGGAETAPQEEPAPRRRRRAR